ncbi:hypothetical protein FS837_002381 [Tulasnella sp. UAMH 9824]|nr:hypothetical protein FS837_002381 [Tulasnella sp. UAMH 9824]
MSSTDLDLEKQRPTPKPAGIPLDSRVDTLQLPPIDSPYNRSSIADELTVVESHGSRGNANAGGDLVDAPGEPKLDEKTEHSRYLVKWDGPDDPENPKNWSVGYRWYITGIAGLLVLNATFASSAPSGVLGQLIPEFHLSHTLAVLTISLFVAGYCVGPLLWGPLSEQYGRKPVLLVAFFVYTGFQVGGALAQNTASFVYGCIYLLFEAYPIVFTIGHHLNAGESGLMFLPLFSGGVLGVIIYLVYFNPIYEAQIPKYAPKMVPPEQRLLPAFYGGPLLMISFLWFGWTSYTSISLWAPLMSGLFMGLSVVFIFLALFNYIIDAYLMVAASALASSTVVRSAFGAGFPLFSTQMYEKLNPRWASTLLAGIALLLLPIPFVLYRYGAHIRRTSKYAPTFD